MRKIDGPGNVSNAFVDYDQVNNPQGTVVTADFMNDVQDELIAIQTDASVAESAGSNAQILKLIKFNAIKYSKNIGEFFYIEENKSPSAFAINTPDNFFPAINLILLRLIRIKDSCLCDYYFCEFNFSILPFFTDKYAIRPDSQTSYGSERYDLYQSCLILHSLTEA